MQDIAIPYWIQHADYQTEEHAPVLLTDAINLIDRYDWKSELEIMEQLRMSGKDFCPPGIGFEPGDGRVLHIVPNELDEFQVHYRKRPRLLGIPLRIRSTSVSCDMAKSQLAYAVTLFYKGEHDRLVALCNNA